jgi:forespore regulator of the sigma-K checkpoint
MKRWARYALCAAVSGCLASFAGVPAQASALVPEPSLVRNDHPVEALFITEYLCGQPKIEKRVLSDISQLAFPTLGPPWHIDKGITLSTSIPVFRRTVEDIAPELKGHIFFGVDDANRLVVYDGLPSRGNVVKRFEPLDMAKMKRGLPETEWRRLIQGIRVDSADDYRSVLSTYSEYFVHHS